MVCVPEKISVAFEVASAFVVELTRYSRANTTASAHSGDRRRSCAISLVTPTRVAISNRRLISCNEKGVTFKWKDYRLEGRERYQVMTSSRPTSSSAAFSCTCARGLPSHPLLWPARQRQARRRRRAARELLTLPIISVDAIKAANTDADQPQTPEHRCPCCGGRMIIIERFERGSNSALSARPADASDQDRRLRIMSIRSPSQNAAILSSPLG